MALTALEDPASEQQIWTYLLLGAISSSVGCCVILSDLVWNTLFPKRNFSILDGPGFLSRALSLSGGTLLTAALYKLLPEALTYLKSAELEKRLANGYLFGAFASGLCLCWVLNAAIHLCTSQSVVHCAHDVEHGAEEPHRHTSGEQIPEESHQHTHYHSHPFNQEGSLGEPRAFSRRSLANLVGCDENSNLLDENSLLLHNHAVHQHYTVPPDAEFQQQAPPMLLTASTRIFKCHSHPGLCRGFSSIKTCSRNVHDSHCDCGDSSFLGVQDEFSPGAYYDPHEEECPQDEADPELHHHHVATTSGQLYSIGIQTALAITMHKFPEGFLLYATSKADEALGFQVFIALALHNFTEGLSVASPLYAALRNRFWALLISITLCAGSQPLGALAAKYLLRDGGIDEDSSFELGVLIATVAGFMTTIGIQMVAMPAFLGITQRVVVSWTTLGVLFVLFVNCI